jgi:hypothetical protein
LPDIPINRRTLPFLIPATLAVVGGFIYFQSKDVALSQARAFVTATPEVVRAVGPAASTTVLKSIYYQGVPGRESPYRQYTMLVTGQSGSSVTVRVRAYPSQTEGIWNVQLQYAN